MTHHYIALILYKVYLYVHVHTLLDLPQLLFCRYKILLKAGNKTINNHYFFEAFSFHSDLKKIYLVHTDLHPKIMGSLLE